MDRQMLEAQRRAKQLMDAEGLKAGEAIEYACEQMEQDDKLGNYTYLELVEKMCSTLPW